MKADDLLRTLAEGLTAYMTFQSRCGMREAYTEYLLYEPILRIVKDKNWLAKTEFIAEVTEGWGDHKRIDFLLESQETEGDFIGIEVKWLPKRKRSLAVGNDIRKLENLEETLDYQNLHSYLVIAGVHKGNAATPKPDRIPKLTGGNCRLFYQTVYDSRYTHYGVTVMRIP